MSISETFKLKSPSNNIVNVDYEYYPFMDSDFILDIMMSVYQHEKYLRQALDSILMQETIYKYRVIIGEDASRDRSREIVLDYQRRHPDIFALILWHKNVGMRMNARTMSKYVAAPYVIMLEGDDYWTDENKIQKQISFLENHKEYIAVSHNVINVDEEGHPLHRDYMLHRFRGPWVFQKEHALRYERPNQTTCIMRRNYFLNWSDAKKEKYFDCIMNGDMKMAATLGMLGKTYVMQDVMAAHRRVFDHGSSWTAYATQKNICYEQYLQAKSLYDYIKEEYGEEMDLASMAKGFYEEAKRRAELSPTEENVNVFENFKKEIGEIYEDSEPNAPEAVKSMRGEIGYLHSENEKKQNLIRIYDMWLSVHQKGKSIGGWMKQNGFHSVVIYGMAELGVRVQEELRGESVEILYGIDRSEILYVADIDVFSMNNLPERRPNVIIVTAMVSFDIVKKQLQEMSFENIFGLDEILFELLIDDKN